MSCTALVIAGVALVVYEGAGLAQPRSSAFSLAAIESESAGPDLTGEASTDAGRPAPQVPTTRNPSWAIPLSKLSATRDRPALLGVPAPTDARGARRARANPDRGRPSPRAGDAAFHPGGNDHRREQPNCDFL